VAIGLVALFIIFAAVIGTTAMVATIGYLLNRIRVIEGNSGSGEGNHQLLDRVTDLGDDLFSMQEQISAMTERLDFTEKLLMSGDDEPESGGPE
jgi:hypothetical protein